MNERMNEKIESNESNESNPVKYLFLPLQYILCIDLLFCIHTHGMCCIFYGISKWERN